MITKITNNDLSEAKEKELAVLDFSAAWCGPCKMLAPVLEHLADDMPNVSFYSIDVDENFPLSHEFGVSSIPCLVVLKHGQEVDRSVGFEPQPAIQAFLEKHL
ncbi:MAG: thioredoxin [Clostridiales bacterium]|jgi:thioredoxin 1|uniref:thioredoxin n=1 Tax=Faecousia sp. TaxID=2952921 RepID=UPI004027A804|nr:thioredoxin [Clostridiales bacterium]